jgi:hypothetical protein
VKSLLTIALLLGSAWTVRAEPLQVIVPAECQTLAQEFGVPGVLQSRTQIIYALYKLKRAGSSHAGVSECRLAVERMKAAYRAQKNPGAQAIVR